MAPDIVIESVISFLCLPFLPFTHARSESINTDSLELQLLTARKKEWWPATADSLPQAVTRQHCDTHYVSRHRTHNLHQKLRPISWWLRRNNV